MRHAIVTHRASRFTHHTPHTAHRTPRHPSITHHPPSGPQPNQVFPPREIHKTSPIPHRPLPIPHPLIARQPNSPGPCTHPSTLVKSSSSKTTLTPSRGSDCKATNSRESTRRAWGVSDCGVVQYEYTGRIRLRAWSGESWESI